MNVITPRSSQTKINDVTVFLAGTIDNGNSVDWQTQVVNAFNSSDLSVTFLNPRRSNWEVDCKNSELHYQINWELDHLESCDIIFMFLAPNSVSPISLLELGTFMESPKDVILVCPNGYYRKDNVEITVGRYTEIEILNSIEDGIKKLRESIEIELMWKNK